MNDFLSQAAAFHGRLTVPGAKDAVPGAKDAVPRPESPDKADKDGAAEKPGHRHFSFLLLFSCQVFLRPVHRDVSDQVHWNWFIERKSDGAPHPFITREFFLEGSPNTVSGGEERVVVLEGGEIQQPAMELVRRHLIADHLLGLWYGFQDGPSDALKARPNVLRETSDVFIHASEGGLCHSVHSWTEPRVLKWPTPRKVPRGVSAVPRRELRGGSWNDPVGRVFQAKEDEKIVGSLGNSPGLLTAGSLGIGKLVVSGR